MLEQLKFLYLRARFIYKVEEIRIFVVFLQRISLRYPSASRYEMDRA